MEGGSLPARGAPSAPQRAREEGDWLDVVPGADLPPRADGYPPGHPPDGTAGHGGATADSNGEHPRTTGGRDPLTRLARLEELTSAVLEEMDQAVVALDRDWRVTRWNAAAERMGHVSRRTVLGHRLWELWPALRGTELERALHATMHAREAREVRQWQDRSRFGGRVLDVRSRPLQDDGVLVIFTETSGRLREQRDRIATAEENTLLLELAGRLADTPDSDALFAVLCDTAMRECDAAGVCITTIVGGELRVLASLGCGVRSAGHVRAIAGSVAARAIAGRELVRERPRPPEPVPTGPTDPVQPGEVMTAPLLAHGEVMGVLTVVRGSDEATFSKRHERRLRLVADHAALALWKSRMLDQALAASEAKSTFLATMSHELRTPLTALTGYGELLADGILGPLSPGQVEMVERMRSVTQGLSAMIDELLTFAGLDSGRDELRVGEVASGDLVRAAAAAVIPLATQKGLAVEVCIPPDAPLLTTDPDRVRQVLGNLAGNAVKFTDSGRVTLSVEGGGTGEDGRPEVRLVVSDTGPGLPAGCEGVIFQPFTQLDSGLTRRHGGTGVGLYIASRIAALLGGRVDVESTPGKGSRFALVLPLEMARRGAR